MQGLVLLQVLGAREGLGADGASEDDARVGRRRQRRRQRRRLRHDFGDLERRRLKSFDADVDRFQSGNVDILHFASVLLGHE